MNTIVAQEKIDPDRVWRVYELPEGARVQVHYVREREGKEKEEGDCIAVFEDMDGMYGLWHNEETGEKIIFNASFKQIDEKNFIIYEEKND